MKELKKKHGEDVTNVLIDIRDNPQKYKTIRNLPGSNLPKKVQRKNTKKKIPVPKDNDATVTEQDFEMVKFDKET